MYAKNIRSRAQICGQISFSFKYTELQIQYLNGEKKIVVLTNQIVDIELTKLFCFPNKFSVFPTNLFFEPTKEFVIAFCNFLSL